MEMVEGQIAARGVKDTLVLNAMRKVPRERFVPVDSKVNAYDDCPLYIGSHQTISQPYIVALMSELCGPDSADIVLEIGTGSGYQAAVLAEIVRKVYTIEIIEELHVRADSVITELGYNNIESKCGDGYFGWPEAGPFDAILITAAPDRIPQPLLDQLKDGGRLVAPVGDSIQYLEIYQRSGDEIKKRRNIPVRFVPMTGKIREVDDD